MGELRRGENFPELPLFCAFGMPHFRAPGRINLWLFAFCVTSYGMKKFLKVRPAKTSIAHAEPRFVTANFGFQMLSESLQHKTSIIPNPAVNSSNVKRISGVGDRIVAVGRLIHQKGSTCCLRLLPESQRRRAIFQLLIN